MILKFSVILLLSAAVQQVVCISSTQKSQIQTGINSLNSLNSYIKSKNFNSFVSSVYRHYKPSMTAMEQLVKAKRANPSGAALTTFNSLKNSFNLAMNEYNKPATGFEDIRRQIDWSVVQVSYGEYERIIRACMLNIKEILDAPFSVTDDRIRHFMTKYESDFRNSAAKIWDGMINSGSFTHNLLQSARKYTQEDRKKVQVFGMGITQLLFQGIEIEIAYAEMKYQNPANTEYVKNTWEKRIASMRSKMSTEDNYVRNAFNSQQVKDYATISAQSGGLNTEQFRDKIYYHMAGKFYWRRFIVVTYDTDGKYFSLASSHCAGGYHQRGNTFVTYASIDNTVNIFTQEKAKQLVDSSNVGNLDSAEALRNTLRSRGGHCSNYALIHVQCHSCGAASHSWISWNSKRYTPTVNIKHGKKFTIWLFG